MIHGRRIKRIGLLLAAIAGCVLMSALIRPIPISTKQSEFINSLSWLTGWVGGRGSSKTHGGSLYILKHAKSADPWMAVSPDAGVVIETTLPTFLAVAEQTGQYLSHKLSPYPRVEFRTRDGGKAEIVFRSGEKPKKLHGSNKAGLWIDEASLQPPEVFLDAIPTLRWRGKMGPCLMTFTPKGKSNYTFNTFFDELDEALIGFDGPGGIIPDRVTWIGGRSYLAKPNTRLIHATSRDNPFLPPEFYETLRGNMSSQLAQQELEGEFIDIAGLMFAREWFKLVDEAPRDALRVRYWDKACFVRGTLVTTDRGQVSIEDVTTRDKVLTREGFKAISWSGVSGSTNTLCTVVFSDNSEVTGTPDHKVWDERRKNWVALEHLGAYDSISITNGNQSWQENQTQTLSESSFKEGRTHEIQTPSIDLNKGITTATNGIRLPSDTATDHCIEISGSSFTVKFPMATILTTTTGIGTTTTWKTSVAYQRLNIGENTRTNSRKKLLSQIANIEKKHCEHLQLQPSPGKSKACAKNAGSLSSGNQSNACIVPSYVAQGFTSVYDLTVENGPPEFFANGTLVHNCTPGGGSYTAGVLVALCPRGMVYIEDVVRGQYSYHERDVVIEQTAEIDQRRYQGEVVIIAEQEGGSGGKEVMHQMITKLGRFAVQRDIVGGKQTRFDNGVTLPGQAKITRAMPLAGQAEAGNVHLVRGKWNQDFLDELIAFPEAKHADQVDGASGGFNRLAGKIFARRDATTKETTAPVNPERFGSLAALERARTRRLFGMGERKR